MIALIVIATGAYFLFLSGNAGSSSGNEPVAGNPPSSNPCDAKAASGAPTVVTMDEQGFHPDHVTIRQCDTVKFVNTGGNDHWPASNIHPTHLIYPEFDPKRGIPAGESWSFVFDRAGTWYSHDHLFPEFTGAVTVQ